MAMVSNAQALDMNLHPRDSSYTMSNWVIFATLTQASHEPQMSPLGLSPVSCTLINVFFFFLTYSGSQQIQCVCEEGQGCRVVLNCKSYVLCDFRAA